LVEDNYTENVKQYVMQLEKSLDVHMQDLVDAAGELMVEMPEPGTVVSKLLRANNLMRRERDAARQRTFDLEAMLSLDSEVTEH